MEWVINLGTSGSAKKGFDSRDMEGQVFGRSIGDYELLSRINRGSISELYKVRSHNTGEVFAMRRLLPHLAGDSDARTTFLRGAEIEIELDHPNILKVYSIHKNNGEPYVIIEYVEGDNLKQWILAKSFEIRLANR